MKNIIRPIIALCALVTGVSVYADDQAKADARGIANDFGDMAGKAGDLAGKGLEQAKDAASKAADAAGQYLKENTQFGKSDLFTAYAVAMNGDQNLAIKTPKDKDKIIRMPLFLTGMWVREGGKGDILGVHTGVNLKTANTAKLPAQIGDFCSTSKDTQTLAPVTSAHLVKFHGFDSRAAAEEYIDMLLDPRLCRKNYAAVVNIAIEMILAGADVSQEKRKQIFDLFWKEAKSLGGYDDAAELGPAQAYLYKAKKNQQFYDMIREDQPLPKLSKAQVQAFAIGN